MPTQKRARSSKTGRFVTLKFALLHPATTVVEIVKRWARWQKG